VWWRHLLAGGIAGAVSRTCTAPLDRLKVHLQVHGGRKDLHIMDVVRYMYKEGGMKGLWRGNGINVIKIVPESALKFWFYDEIKKRIKGDDARDLFIYERFLAGSSAGVLSQTVIYPLEVMKTRLALRRTGEITGILDCAKQIYKAEGWKVFYKGFWPNIFGIIPYAGIDLAVYETLKKKISDKFNSENKTPNALTLLLCGTLSSCCGQLAAYPLALIRTKLQSQAGIGAKLSLPREQTHALGLIRYIVRTEGVRGLYRGIVPNFCKVAPAVSISYYVYERTRSRLGVEMS
jgi:solute carrier family 25 phosphate transporter 23/24/25/41